MSKVLVWCLGCVHSVNTQRTKHHFQQFPFFNLQKKLSGVFLNEANNLW